MDDRLKQHELGYWEMIDKPTPEELKKYYAEKYYQEAHGSYEHVYTEGELSFFGAKLTQQFAVVKTAIPHLPQGKGRLLDVGCGEGYTLAFFREQGWSVKGIDFSSAGVSSKNPDCLDALNTGDLFELLDSEIAAGNTYDVLWLQHVLEHVVDPLELLVSLKKLIAKNGIAVITVPNDGSLTQSGALRHNHIDRAFWVAPPDHLTYFDRNSLINITNKTGWENIEVTANFPIDWFLFHAGSNYIQDKLQGKPAHFARIEIENLINERPPEDVNRFWSSLAKLGMGRDITIFLRPQNRDNPEKV